MFRVIFVLDIYNGAVVHARGGDRRHYRPVHLSSQICDTSIPTEIVSLLHPREVYMADLNILQGDGDRNTNFDAIRQVSQHATTMLDAGVRRVEDIDGLLPLSDTLILGTETTSLETIRTTASANPGKVNISIDRKDGRILSNDENMPNDPCEIVKILNEISINDIIFLDLDRVGTSSGVDTQLLSEMVSLSEHSILLGGGVKGVEDINILEDVGIEGALVATALHNGSIPLTMIQ